MSTIFPLGSASAPRNSTTKRVNHRNTHQKLDLGQGVQNERLGPEEVASGEQFIAAPWAYLLLPANKQQHPSKPTNAPYHGEGTVASVRLAL